MKRYFKITKEDFDKSIIAAYQASYAKNSELNEEFILLTIDEAILEEKELVYKAEIKEAKK